MSQILVHLALFGANLIYGANYGIAKQVMPDPLNPFAIIVMRVTIAGALFWILHQLTVKDRIPKADWPTVLPRLFLCAIFGVVSNQLLFFNGLARTSPINAAVIMVMTPILVLLVSAVLIKEKITLLKAIGMLVGAIGAFFLIGGTAFQFDPANIIGDLMIVANATSYAIYLVLVKPLMAKYHAMTIIKWVFLFGALVIVPVSTEDVAAVDWATMPLWAWASLGFIVIGTTFLAYWLNAIALKHVSPSVVGAYIYLQPVLAALFGYYFYEENLTWEKGVASLVIFVGVYMVNRPKPKVKTFATSR